MSAPNSCCTPCCPTTEYVQTPGLEGDPGAAGAAGTDGVDSFTTTTANFVVPSVGANVTVSVANSSWMVIGQNVVVQAPANFIVISKPNAASVTLQFLHYGGDVAVGATINSGAQVGPAGITAPLSASLPTALTDNSTGTASNTIAAGSGVFTLAIPIVLVQITGAGDVLTTYTPGFRFKILSVDARVTQVATTISKAVSLNFEINTTDLTGGVVALTSANCTPLGAAIAGSSVTANNVGTATDSFSVESSSVTAFAEGAVVLLVRIQNMDTADAIASLADHVNDLITSLTP